MGMSTHVVGFRPPDEKWRQMKGVWDACEKAGVSPPEDVQRFFDWAKPDEAGIEVKLSTGSDGYVSPVAREWTTDCADGFEIDLEELRERHPQVTKIRFWNSW